MQVGAHTYHAEKITELFGYAKLYIGKYCSIADNITVMLGSSHHVEWISTYPFDVVAWTDLPQVSKVGSSKGDVVIGNDVWIGQDVLILPGVTIGDGAVIGARSVVTKNVGPYEVWAGNPARWKRDRFSSEDIAALLSIKWWNWPDERVKQAAPILLSGDLESLKKFAGYLP